MVTRISFCLLITGLLFSQAYAQTDTTIGGAVTGKEYSEKIDSVAEAGQTPHIYRMNYWVSGTFSVIATAANIYAIPNIIKAKNELTDEELNALNPTIYSGFDRWALQQDPAERDQYYKASDYVLPGIIVGVGALAFDKSIRKDWLRIFMMYYETHAITFSLYNFSFFGPAFQNKLRPYVFYDDYYTADQRRGGNQRNSMYSGHTASAAAATFFMVKVYSDYHPEIGRKKYLLYGLASVPPLVEGYLRMKALTHFPSDIMIGYLIGATCGVAVPALHRFKSHGIQVGLTSTPVGPGLSMNWTPVYK
jgi:membrane-associated phospholipid phosphatase